MRDCTTLLVASCSTAFFFCCVWYLTLIINYRREILDRFVLKWKYVYTAIFMSRSTNVWCLLNPKPRRLQISLCHVKDCFFFQSWTKLLCVPKHVARHASHFTHHKVVKYFSMCIINCYSVKKCSELEFVSTNIYFFCFFPILHTIPSFINTSVSFIYIYIICVITYILFFIYIYIYEKWHGTR